MPIRFEGIEVDKWIGNGLSLGAIIGSIAGWLPPIAALIAIIWYLIQIYESDSVQTWLHTRRLRTIARLKKQQAALEALETIDTRRQGLRAILSSSHRSATVLLNGEVPGKKRHRKSRPRRR